MLGRNHMSPPPLEACSTRIAPTDCPSEPEWRNACGWFEPSMPRGSKARWITLTLKGIER